MSTFTHHTQALCGLFLLAITALDLLFFVDVSQGRFCDDNFEGKCGSGCCPDGVARCIDARCRCSTDPASKIIKCGTDRRKSDICCDGGVGFECVAAANKCVCKDKRLECNRRCCSAFPEPQLWKCRSVVVNKKKKRKRAMCVCDPDRTKALTCQFKIKGRKMKVTKCCRPNEKCGKSVATPCACKKKKSVRCKLKKTDRLGVCCAPKEQCVDVNAALGTKKCAPKTKPANQEYDDFAEEDDEEDEEEYDYDYDDQEEYYDEEDEEDEAETFAEEAFRAGFGAAWKLRMKA